MYRRSFPTCKIVGDYSPVEFSIVFSDGAIPKKCEACENLFEGECTRDYDQVENYSRLDHGFCGVEGDSSPTLINTCNDFELYVPNKCKNCTYLKEDTIRTYVCGKDADIWKDLPRSLDWGNWKPKHPIVNIKRVRTISSKKSQPVGPANISKELVELIKNNKVGAAIKLYRKINNITFIGDAKEEIEQIIIKLKKYG